ncbi:MAG: HD domain-containing protein [Salinivirgaceae bacterium]|nr:HD domain-containing protein [Salinivirgaceae bacterium]
MNNKNTKTKIVNDPVLGLIDFSSPLILQLIEHPWLQRLRRIKQLGMSDMVYPGAQHTRFLHTIGATSLMQLALDTLRLKGADITDHERESAMIAILLHDIGHCPFSHALEHHIADTTHEDISLVFMDKLNRQFDGALSTAIEIFTHQYPKQYLTKLVSGQLDVDRLDYLRRDSFFTGVSEGIVSTDRIIKMLDVVDDQLVVEKKGIYSIEKFLVARRLMYWQVYLHKTVHSAEQLLINILRRAKWLVAQGEKVEASSPLKYFLTNHVVLDDFKSDAKRDNGLTTLENFAMLDDTDLMVAVKAWTTHPDRVLSRLCLNLVNRRLPKTIVQDQPADNGMVSLLTQGVMKKYNLTEDEAGYFVSSGVIANKAYSQRHDQIFVKEKDGSITEIVNEADMLNIRALSTTVSKYYISWPKDIND